MENSMTLEASSRFFGRDVPKSKQNTAPKVGDLAGFNRLVLQYQDAIYNQAYRLLGDEEAAADMTQDTFIQAFRKLPSYRGGSMKAWLMRIVTNYCYDSLRYQRRHPVKRLEPVDEDGEEFEVAAWIIDPSDPVEHQVEQSELGEKLQGFLNELTPEYRSVVVLVDIQGMNYQEVAKVLNISLGTVKSRLSRARMRLREALRRENYSL